MCKKHSQIACRLNVIQFVRYFMEITDIRVRKMMESGKLKGIVSVTFDNAFVVHDIKIIEGAEKTFVAMPSRKTPEQDFKDIVHPINQEFRDYLSSNVLEKYELCAHSD